MVSFGKRRRRRMYYELFVVILGGLSIYHRFQHPSMLNWTSYILQSREVNYIISQPSPFQVDQQSLQKNYSLLDVKNARSEMLPIIVDPLALRKRICNFILCSSNGVDLESMGRIITQENWTGWYWYLMKNYQYSPEKDKNKFHSSSPDGNNDQHHYFEHDVVSQEIICGTGPGRGIEQDAGYKLMVEKMRMFTTNKISRFLRLSSVPIEEKRIKASPPVSSEIPKILCLMYTYSPMRYLARAQALTWGWKCDGFLAISNETVPEYGIFDIRLLYMEHHDENYNNMWQKTRRIWNYVHQKFLLDYDYFYLSGDDVYLMVDNFRDFLVRLHEHDSQIETRHNLTQIKKRIPRHLGAWIPTKAMVAGGPGYALNRAALGRFIEESGRSGWKQCYAGVRDSREDWFISKCLASNELNIWGNDTDTRDINTGEQRFHDTNPASLYTFRANLKGRSYFSRMATSWKDQSMPLNNKSMVGPRHGLQGAATYSFSIHHVNSPIYTARIHSIMHPLTTCPIYSPLGRGLQQHIGHYDSI